MCAACKVSMLRIETPRQGKTAGPEKIIAVTGSTGAKGGGLEESRALNPRLQTFRQWLEASKRLIPTS